MDPSGVYSCCLWTWERIYLMDIPLMYFTPPIYQLPCGEMDRYLNEYKKALLLFLLNWGKFYEKDFWDGYTTWIDKRCHHGMGDLLWIGHLFGCGFPFLIHWHTLCKDRSMNVKRFCCCCCWLVNFEGEFMLNSSKT